MREQRLADPLAAQRRANEEIFQIDARATRERRKIDEPDREAGRLAVPLRDLAEQLWMIGEQRFGDISLRGIDFVKQFLVFGEFADQRQNKAHLIGARAADGEGHSIAPTATSALM